MLAYFTLIRSADCGAMLELTRKTPTLAAALVLTLGLTACQGIQNNPKQTAGTLLGGVGGAVIGSQFGGGTGRLAATRCPAHAGSVAWKRNRGVARPRGPRIRHASARTRLPRAIGETIRWDNPRSGHHGSYTPIRDGHTDAGAYCRQYRTTVNIDGRAETAYGTACQQPDGTWRIVDN